MGPGGMVLGPAARQERQARPVMASNLDALGTAPLDAQDFASYGALLQGKSSSAGSSSEDLGDALRVTSDELEDWLSAARQESSTTNDSFADAGEEETEASRSRLARRGVAQQAVDATYDGRAGTSTTRGREASGQDAGRATPHGKDAGAAADFFFQPAKAWVTSVLRRPNAAAATAAPAAPASEELRRRDDAPSRPRRRRRGRIHW